MIVSTPLLRRAGGLAALLAAVTLATSTTLPAPACCGQKPTPRVQDAGALAIQGPTTSPAFKLVELAAVGDMVGKSFFWDCCPRCDMRELPDGKLIFTGAPGVYEITLRAVSLADGKTSTAAHKVTIEKPAGAPSTPPTVPPGTPPAGQINPEKALSQIKFPAGEGLTSYCTATVVYPRREDGKWNILTAAHCVPGVGAKGTLTTRDRAKTFAVTAVAHDEKCDLCWLVTDEPQEGLYCAVLAKTNPVAGTAVWHAGYGVDKPENRESGTVKHPENSDGQTQYYLSVSSGDSGGGIFDAKTGELLSAVCCTKIKGVKTDMWGGSPRQAARLRPTSDTAAPHGEFIPARPTPAPAIREEQRAPRDDFRKIYPERQP